MLRTRSPFQNSALEHIRSRKIKRNVCQRISFPDRLQQNGGSRPRNVPPWRLIGGRKRFEQTWLVRQRERKNGEPIKENRVDMQNIYSPLQVKDSSKPRDKLQPRPSTRTSDQYISSCRPELNQISILIGSSVQMKGPEENLSSTHPTANQSTYRDWSLTPLLSHTCQFLCRLHLTQQCSWQINLGKLKASISAPVHSYKILLKKSLEKSIIHPIKYWSKLISANSLSTFSIIRRAKLRLSWIVLPLTAQVCSRLD